MKYSRSQLKEVKKALREYKEKEDQENANEEAGEIEDDAPVSLIEARALARSLVTEEEAKEKNKSYNAEINLRREARERQEVTVDWQVNIGDAVVFNMNGENEFGIVVEKRSGTARNKKAAMRSGGIKVMSSAGQYWLSPVQVSKLEE